jgi:hypothetical protein
MSAGKKAEPKEPKPEPAESPKLKPTPQSSVVGGLAELQANADADTARGYTGPEKENTND